MAIFKKTFIIIFLLNITLSLVTLTAQDLKVKAATETCRNGDEYLIFEFPDELIDDDSTSAFRITFIEGFLDIDNGGYIQGRGSAAGVVDIFIDPFIFDEDTHLPYSGFESTSVDQGFDFNSSENTFRFGVTVGGGTCEYSIPIVSEEDVESGARCNGQTTIQLSETLTEGNIVGISGCLQEDDEITVSIPGEAGALRRIGENNVSADGTFSLTTDVGDFEDSITIQAGSSATGLVVTKTYTTVDTGSNVDNNFNSKQGLEACYEYEGDTQLPLDENGQSCIQCYTKGGLWVAIGCVDPTPLGIITGLIRIAFGIMGGVALIQLIQAGIAYQKGDQAGIEKAKGKVFATLSGVALLVFSVLILRIIGINVLDVLPENSV